MRVVIPSRKRVQACAHALKLFPQATVCVDEAESICGKDCPAFCGDYNCDPGEDSENCPQDCGYDPDWDGGVPPPPDWDGGVPPIVDGGVDPDPVPNWDGGV